MITDTERLDWLEKNQQSLYTVIDIKKTLRTDGSNCYDQHRLFVGWTVGSIDDEFLSIREAIDNAIARSN